MVGIIMEQKTEDDKKDCRECRHFDTKSDWMVVDYRTINEDLSISDKTVGDDNPILKQTSKHEGGFGKVLTVCEKQEIVLARNRASVCNDFERKDLKK